MLNYDEEKRIYRVSSQELVDIIMEKIHENDPNAKLAFVQSIFTQEPQVLNDIPEMNMVMQ